MQGKQHGAEDPHHAQKQSGTSRRYTKGPDGTTWIGVRDNGAEWRRIKKAIARDTGYGPGYFTEAFCLANQGDHFGVDDPVGCFVTVKCRSVSGGPESMDNMIEPLASACSDIKIISGSGSECMTAMLDASYVTKPNDGYDRLVALVPANVADATAVGCAVSLDQAKEFRDEFHSRVNGPSGMRSIIGQVRLCAMSVHHERDTPLGDALYSYCKDHRGADGFKRVFVAATDAGYTANKAVCLATRSTAPSS
nr:hypothetical protein [Pandoravirus massiliensis]